MKKFLAKLLKLFFRIRGNDFEEVSPELYKNYLSNPKKYWEARGLVNEKRIFNGSLLQEHMTKSYSDAFLNVVKNYSSSSILEAGAGYGRMIRFLRDNLPVLRYIAGSDISLAQIRSAYKLEGSLRNDRKVIHYIVADTCNLPYADNRFDLVYTYGSLTHISPNLIMDAIKELLRVTKNYLVICEPHSEEYSRKIEISFVHSYKDIIVNMLNGAVLEQLVCEDIGKEELDYRLYVFKVHKNLSGITFASQGARKEFA